MIRASIGLAGLAAVSLMPLVRRDTTPVIGILEQPPQCNKARTIGLRPLFARRGQRWVPLLGHDSLRDLGLASRQFTLVFDGKSLGTLNAADSGFRGDDWSFRRDHFLDIEPGQRPPQLANRARRFAGWCDTPALRPVVAVTSGHSEDPDSWKPFEPDQKVRERLLPAFRAVVGKADICRHTVSAKGDSSEHDETYRYTSRDLVVVGAYRDVRGREIVGLLLKESVRPCDYFMDPQAMNHWFFVGPSVRHLGDEMDLVDAGDFDGDGRSELLFWRSADDADGYVLVYDDFAKKAKFYWNYH